jgi:hypothetical protein
VTRPGLPIFTRFYQAKILFLVTLICNDLPKSCCIVHLDQCYAVSVPIVYLFYLSTGVRAKRATASSSCCFDDFPLRLHLFMSLRPDSVGSWSVSFFDMGFRSSLRCIQHSSRIPSQLTIARTGDGVYIFLLSLNVATISATIILFRCKHKLVGGGCHSHYV